MSLKSKFTIIQLSTNAYNNSIDLQFKMVLQTLTTAQVHCQALEYLLPNIQISELSKEAVPTTQCENSMKNFLSQKPFQMKQVRNKPFLLLI